MIPRKYNYKRASSKVKLIPEHDNGYNEVIKKAAELFRWVEHDEENRILKIRGRIAFNAMYSWNETKWYIEHNFLLNDFMEVSKLNRNTQLDDLAFEMRERKFRFLSNEFMLQYLELKAKEVEFIKLHEG